MEKGRDKPSFRWLEKILFKSGKVIKDSSIIIDKQRFISTTVYASLAGIASLGIIVALVFVTFNIIFREKRLLYMVLKVTIYCIYSIKILYLYIIFLCFLISLLRIML